MEKEIQYSNLFEKEEIYGKLSIKISSQTSGRTFHLYVLCDNGRKAVEVFQQLRNRKGIWLHKGKWEEDFKKLVMEKKREFKAVEERLMARFKKEQTEKKNGERELLSHY